MQERMVLGAAPMTPEQGVRADEVEGTGNVLAMPFGKNQQGAVSQPLIDQ